MNNKKYWQKRAEQIAGRQFEKTDDYISTIVQEYEKALSGIEKDIESFYIRFSENNEITMTEAKRLLNTKELKEFNWTVEEYIKKGKENAIDQRWMKELENASTKVRVSRLEALQTQMQQQVEMLTNSQQEGMTNLLSDIYQDTYYRNIYEVYNGLGIEVNFAKSDIQTIEKIINQKWLEGNFSSRIWDNRNKLITELQTTLVQSVIRGDSINKTSSLLAKRMNVSKSRATTFINTESAYITNKATIDSYKNSGVVKEYEILSTLDNRTSQICRSMDGKVFKISEMQPGINAPPFHPNCRTTTIAYFSDAEDETRIARDGEGQNYSVDGNITYKEWYDRYVKSNPVEVLAEKKIKNRYSDKEQYEKYKEVLGKEIPNSFDKFQELKYNNSEEWESLKNTVKIKSSSYNEKGKEELNSIVSDINWSEHLKVSVENSSKLNEVHTNLNEFMHKNNREKIYLLDKNLNKIIYQLEGSKKDEVMFDKEIIKLLKGSEENSIILSHNHPSKTTFSRYDIEKIIKYKSIDALTLECIDGTKYVLDRGELKSSFIKDFNFMGKYQQVYDNIATKYPELNDEIKIYDIWDQFIDEVTEEIAKKYDMIYKKVR